MLLFFPHTETWHFHINHRIWPISPVNWAVARLKQTRVRIMMIYRVEQRISQINTFVICPTYHFLQPINEVTDDDPKAFELLEHCAKFLAGAFAHICARFVRLLTDNVCSDGGTYIQNLTALAHSINVIWRTEKRQQGWKRKQANERTTQFGDGKHIWKIWWMKPSKSDQETWWVPVFLKSAIRSQQCCDYNVYCVPKNRCLVSGVWFEKTHLFEMVTLNLSTRDDSTVGRGRRGEDGIVEHEKQKQFWWKFPMWWENHAAVINRQDLR